MSFKIYNPSVDEIQKINDLSTKMNSEPLRNILVLDNVGGSMICDNPNGTLIYSSNQSPGQIVIDVDLYGQSPPVGTEFIIYAGNHNTVNLETQKTAGRLQISGGATNTSNLNIILPLNTKCTATKITSVLWIVQGENLTYDG